jgi:hypothetical protein
VSRFALADPAVRNLQITQCCCELSRALAARTGGGPANWCRVATWASKQAAQRSGRRVAQFGHEGGRMRTVLTFHRGEPATIPEQSGIDEPDMDPPGTERMTLGRWVDEIMERRREAAPCKR